MTIETGLFDREITISSDRHQHEQILQAYRQHLHEMKPLPEGEHTLSNRFSVLVLKDGSGWLISTDNKNGQTPEIRYLDPKLNLFISIISRLEFSADIQILKGVVVVKEGPNP